MRKSRVVLAGAAVGGLLALPAVMIPAGAAPATGSASTSASSSSASPLLTVCVTVTPKAVGVTVNGGGIVLGPVGVPRNCVAV